MLPSRTPDNREEIGKTEKISNRSSSLPSVTDLELESSTTSTKYFEKNGDQLHALSSDSCLSVGSNQSMKLDCNSDMSLPELSNTHSDSEGYSSFRSSGSSPWSSHHTSPTETGEMMATLDEQLPNGSSEDVVDSVPGQCVSGKDFDSNLYADCASKEQAWLLCKSAKQCTVGHGLNGGEQHSKQRAEQNDLPNTIVSNRMKKPEGENKVLTLELSTSSPKETANVKKRPQEVLPGDGTSPVINTSTPIQSSTRHLTLLERRMSTIEESYEDTPSPRSFMDIDKEFFDAYKELTKKQVLEHFSKGFHDLNPSYDVSDSDILSDQGAPNMPSPAMQLDAAAKQETTADSKIDNHDNCPVEKIAALSDQAFDGIDLKSYDIPKERRLSLEFKLTELRVFVDRIIDDRKNLEEDRVSLEKTLSKMKEQGASSCEVCKGFFENKCSAAPPVKNEEEVACLAQNDSKIRRGEQDFESMRSTQYQELLKSLETALLENVGLKNENRDLCEINDELRQKIEQLLTDGEELQYKMNEATFKLMEDAQRQREENLVLRNNFNKVLKDCNMLEKELQELEENYQDLICERDLLVDELNIRNEDFQICRDECEKLAADLHNARQQVQSLNANEEKVWTRADWEQWTVMLTRVATTEKALFDVRKQKSQIVNDMKSMKKRLEESRDRIQDAENAMKNLECNLEKAQDNNNSLQHENEEMRASILRYELKILELQEEEKEEAKEMKVDESREEITEIVAETERQEDIGSSNISVEQDRDLTVAPQAECSSEKATFRAIHDVQSESEENVGGSQLVVLRTDPKIGSIKRARTFPCNQMESFALQMFRDTASPVDEYAGSQYQNAFQEIGQGSEEINPGGDDTDAIMMKSPVRQTDAIRDMHVICHTCLEEANSTPSGNPLKQGKGDKVHNRSSCLPLKNLLPSMMQNILNTKSKRERRNEGSSPCK
eukprot:Seg2946.1 transcript_id=Seg2946.1/GoldUCD/mRNA.D3Y31 product="hypothetical protein" protein_id=Seg2946.1/GoldUCD/D3Y31